MLDNKLNQWMFNRKDMFYIDNKLSRILLDGDNVPLNIPLFSWGSRIYNISFKVTDNYLVNFI